MIRVLAWLALATIALAPPRAFAATLAVLPLSQGAGSESYSGLGTALAGMLVADLSQVESLSLVERERLDALLAEIALSDSGYVEEATAQRLGEGLGAEMVVIGSWSVVDAAFLMDARIVGVESGSVVKAVSAEGTLEDFVSVEKDLVERLVDGLDVALSSSARRRILGTAPTESFAAFSAYGAGLDAEAKGDVEAARVAFERALATDPAFAAARAALTGLRTAVADAQARATAAAATERSAATEAVLARTDPASRVDVALRLMVLENEGAHCQRYEEMLAFGRSTAWAVTLSEDEIRAVRDRAAELGLAALPDDVPGPEAAHDDPRRRAQDLLESLDDYLFGVPWLGREHQGSGLVASLEACRGPESALEAVGDLRASVSASAAGQDRVRPRALTAVERLDVYWAYQWARHFGSGPELEARLQSLMDALADSEARPNLMEDIDLVLAQAQQWEDDQARRWGASDTELRAAMAALAHNDGSTLDLENSYCAYFATTWRAQAVAWDARWGQLQDDPVLFRNHMQSAGAYYASLASLGCLARPARWTDNRQIAAHLRTAIDGISGEKRADPRCAVAIATLEQALMTDLDAPPAHPNADQLWALSALTTYFHHLAHYRCVDDRLP